ncbi:MAG: DUF5069 domain-containing protein [Chthoniobacter sp.]|uniref:DUF5069 domain-containing protein n=1 Tax=Chthoniobacter sp. TaxID=2510640 RepID=UPI0032AACFF2
MNQFTSPDLTQRPPRSPRITLGGYVMLPRILDKCRALIAGKNGEYRFGIQRMDRHFLTFTGIDEAALQAEVATGKNDSEMLAWVQANAKPPREPWEIAQWSHYQIQRAADSDAETLQFFAEAVAKFSTTREDIKTWFDLLDLDDYVTFGGRP